MCSVTIARPQLKNTEQNVNPFGESLGLDDYQLKVRNLLRNSAFRDTITELPKGSFVFPESDMMLTTEPFKQNGKPYEWKPQPKAEPQKKKGILERLFPNFMRNWNEVKQQRQIQNSQATNSEEIYHCPSCGQECTQEEYESGFCLDCDQIEMFGE